MRHAPYFAFLRDFLITSALLSLSACAVPGRTTAAPAGAGITPPRGMANAADKDIWPEPFPAAGRDTLRPALTAGIRRRLGTLGLNGMKGLAGEGISRAIALFSEDRARAGVITFEIESGADAGIHQCEALGRGSTSLEPKPGWIQGTVREPDGRATAIFYAPKESPDGATPPGIYELRNMRPAEYKIKFLNPDLSGEEALAQRLRRPDEDDRLRFTGVWKHWYPRDPQYSDIAPVDMVWSAEYQRFSQGADVPLFELAEIKKDPDQASRNPMYYTGPNGRYGMAVHTDRWDDQATALDENKAASSEFRSFLFRDTAGCVKVRPDCLMLINRFIDEQAAKNRAVQLEVRELKPQ